MKIGFIGCGNMGGALARAISKQDARSIYLYDKDEARASALAKELGANTCDLNGVIDSDLLFLGVKPNVAVPLLSSFAEKLGEQTVIVSMAAGVSIAQLEAVAPGRAIIRIMPNTPVAYGVGMVLAARNNVDEDKFNCFREIISHAGRLDEIPEKLIDAGTAVCGCGPAFVYMFIEALADGGVAAGLTRDKALLYAAQTVMGAGCTVLESGRHPGALKDAVCSPGGSTIEGVMKLECGGLRGVVSSAVSAAFEKTKSLGK